MFKRFINGDYSLAKTFWIPKFLIVFPLLLIGKLVRATIEKLSPETLYGYIPKIIAFDVFCFVVGVVLLVAIGNALSKYEGSKVIKGITYFAVILSGLDAFNTIFNIHEVISDFYFS